jgi:hypothetical protein
MAKFKRGAIRGIQSHVRRERPPRTNPDVDPSRSGLNYSLLGGGGSMAERAEEAVRELAPGARIRSDSTWMCGFIVSSDRAFFDGLEPEGRRAYFEDALEFLKGRYGAGRLIEAAVHMDEATPHMHALMVPVTADGRLSAKSLFDRGELKRLQTDFAAEVGAKRGLLRGIEGSGARHVKEIRFKAEKAEAALAEASKALEAKEAAARALDAAMAEKAASLGAAIAEREGKAASLDASIAEREKRAASLGASIAEKEKRAGALDASIAERERASKAMAAMIASSEERLARLSPLLKEREAAAAALGAEIERKSKEAESLAAEALRAEKALAEIKAKLRGARIDAWTIGGFKEPKDRKPGITGKVSLDPGEYRRLARAAAIGESLGRVKERLEGMLEEAGRLNENAGKLGMGAAFERADLKEIEKAFFLLPPETRRSLLADSGGRPELAGAPPPPLPKRRRGHDRGELEL